MTDGCHLLSLQLQPLLSNPFECESKTSVERTDRTSSHPFSNDVITVILLTYPDYVVLKTYAKVIYCSLRFPQDFWEFWRMREQCVPGALPPYRERRGRGYSPLRQLQDLLVWKKIQLCNYITSTCYIMLYVFHLSLKIDLMIKSGFHLCTEVLHISPLTPKTANRQFHCSGPPFPVHSFQSSDCRLPFSSPMHEPTENPVR